MTNKLTLHNTIIIIIITQLAQPELHVYCTVFKTRRDWSWTEHISFIVQCSKPEETETEQNTSALLYSVQTQKRLKLNRTHQLYCTVFKTRRDWNWTEHISFIVQCSKPEETETEQNTSALLYSVQNQKRLKLNRTHQLYCTVFKTRRDWNWTEHLSLCVISGFRCEVPNICALLGYYAG